MADEYYQDQESVYTQGKYTVYRKLGNVLPGSGGTAPTIYTVVDTSNFTTRSNFDSKESAVDYIDSLLNSETKIYVAEKTTNADGRVEETKPPTLPPSCNNTIAQTGSNRPSTPAVSVGECGPGTTLDKTNSELVYNCDWTNKLNIEVCGKKLELIALHWTKRLALKAESMAESVMPLVEYIKNIYDTIKGYFDILMEYIKEIKDLIKCVTSVISAITETVTFIATLPVNIIAQTMNCLNGFAGMLKTAATMVTEPVTTIANEGQTAINGMMTTANDIKSTSDKLTNPVLVPKPKLQIP